MKANNFPKIDIAVLEATLIEEDGSIVPTTSVGNSGAFAALANQFIIEVNLAVPFTLCGLHDLFSTGDYPNRSEIPIVAADTRIGRTTIPIDPKNIAGIVITNKTDSPAEIAPADEATKAIAKHLVQFFANEVSIGNLPKSLLPLTSRYWKSR